MTAFASIVIFLILFAIILIAVSLGHRFIESQHKKQVETMLTTVSGEPEEQQESILLAEEEEDPLEVLLKKSNLPTRLHDLLQQGGVPWSVSRFILTMVIAAVAAGVLGWVLRPLGFRVLSTTAFAIFGGTLPLMYIAHKKKKRMFEFEQQLPEALDFLARSMRAGHAFSISLEMLGSDSPDPLGQEIRALFNEQNLGAPIEAALTNFARRVPLLDVRLFISSVLLQRQTGGNLSEVLTRLAYIIRERFRLKGQVKAASAHGRLTSLVLTALPIVLIVALMIIAPGYLESLAADPDGKWMIVGAILAQILGYIIMRRITEIKV
jgi:tight adherence protein B